MIESKRNNTYIRYLSVTAIASNICRIFMDCISEFFVSRNKTQELKNRNKIFIIFFSLSTFCMYEYVQ